MSKSEEMVIDDLSASAKHFALTKKSCYLGIFVQAISCNIIAILFIPLMELYGFSYVDLGILVAINFTAQIMVDVIFSGVIDKWGFRKIALPALFCGFLGLLLLAASPYIFGENIFAGIVIATVIFAASSGLLEVLISPISNAIPSEHKGASMSFMHSFYAWGQVATIAVTTIFIFIFSGKYWQIIVLLWSIVPLINFFMFLKAPFPKTISESERHNTKSIIFKPFYLIALLAIMLGASTEITMAQWTSTFMERGLNLPKVAGDMLGMCGFAVMMGVGRLTHGIYGAKLNMNNVLITGSIVSAICYIVVALSPSNMLNILACVICGLSASLLWPGTLVLSAERFPMAGAWMFAILAAAGDIGGAIGPYLTGAIVDSSITSDFALTLSTALKTTPEQAAIRIGILVAAIFPMLAIGCHIVLKRMRAKRRDESQSES